MVGNPSSHDLTSSVELDIFINTSMACSQMGGMTQGEGGVTKVGRVSGGLAGGGGGVEAAGSSGGPGGGGGGGAQGY